MMVESKKTRLHAFILWLVALLLICCSTGSKINSGQGNSEKTVENTTIFSLAENLRLIPGVLVGGPPGNYYVRVTSARNSDRSPLFIVNGQYAMSFRDAALLLSGMEIISTELLPDLESDGYGRRGEGGVIVIMADKN